jgi:RNA polymerase sigma-70 factor, ECF subfamily
VGGGIGALRHLRLEIDEYVMVPDRRDELAKRIVHHQHRVFAYIATLLANHDDAEDVFQSTCLILWRKWDEFDADRDFFSWACGVAHNEVRNFLRRGQRNRLHLSEEVLTQVANTRLMADDVLEARSRFLALCMKKLSEDQRRLVEQCYAGAEPIKAIAEAMGISPAALTMRLQRIRKILFECMTRALEDEPRHLP